MESSFFTRLEVIKKSLQKVGFSLEESERQIEHVGKVVTMAIFTRLLKERSSATNLTPDNIGKYLHDNFNVEYLRQVIDIESNKIVQEYLSVVKGNLPPSSQDQMNNKE